MKEFQEWQRQLALRAAVRENEERKMSMTKREAWEFLSEHIEEAAGYEESEYEEMAEYIEQFEEALRIVDDTMRKS